MNIDNLNPENNNQNLNPNPGVAPTFPAGPEPTVAPVEPNFGVPPVEPVNPAPIPPVNPVPVNPSLETPSPVNQSTAATINPLPTNQGTINLNPEGVASNEVVVDPPSPLMGSTLTANTPLTNNPINNQPNINNTPLNTNNMINELPSNPATFGGIPTPSEAPIADEFIPQKPTKKKGSKKALIIILIFILILGIGTGVYYFLNVANQTVGVSVSSLLEEWELGTKLSTNPADYATIVGVDASTCTLNMDGVNVNAANSYSYSITCPGLREPVSGNLRVRDTKGPEVKLKELTVKPETAVYAEDFIAECSDPSVSDECDVSIVDDSVDLEDMVQEVGTYTIPLLIQDDFNNETKVDATLIVSESAPSTFLSCELASSFETSTKGDVTVSYEYGADDNNELVSVKKIVTYEFENQSDYEEAKTEYEENQSLDNIQGKETFDDEEKTITITADINVDDLQEELSSETELKTYEDVAIYHETIGDMCTIP